MPYLCLFNHNSNGGIDMATPIRFKVIPNSLINRFPIDMLRYDACYPNTSTDASSIDLSINQDCIYNYNEIGPIELIHMASNRNWKPTFKRWESFGWKVIDCDNWKAPK
jgi:hypothetical protein